MDTIELVPGPLVVPVINDKAVDFGNPNTDDYYLDESQKIKSNNIYNLITGIMTVILIILLLSIFFLLFVMKVISPKGLTIEEYFRGTNRAPRKGTDPIVAFTTGL